MAGYNRVIIKGAGPDGEVWSTGLAYGAGVNPVNTTDDLLAWATSIAALVSAWTTAQPRVFMSSALSIVAIRTEYRLEDESLANLQEFVLTNPVVGTGTISKTLQTSAVLTLQSATPGGRGRGRMYWPAVGFTPTASGRFTTSNLTAFLSDMRQLIIDIRDAPDPIYTVYPAVRSITDHVSRAIITLRAGNVPDTQRRRRDALVEVYSSIAV